MSLRPPAPPGRPATSSDAEVGGTVYRYLMLVGLCGVGGVLGAFTGVGLAFLLLAAGLALAAPFRGNRPLFWAIIGGTLGFLVTVTLAAPLACLSRPSPSITATGIDTQSGLTVCRNLAGMTFSTMNGSSPSLAPSLLIGLGAAAAVAVAAVLLFRRRPTPV